VHQIYNILSQFNDPALEPIFFTARREKPNDTLMPQFEALPIPREWIDGTAKDVILGILFGRGKIIRAMKALAPDVVHTNGIVLDLLGYRLAKMTKCKLILTIHSHVFGDYPHKFGRIAGTALAYLHLALMKDKRYVSRVVCCSKSLSQIYGRENGAALRYIRNGVDTTRFSRSTLADQGVLREKLGIPPGKRVFITVARMVKVKNIAETIRAFANNNLADDVLLVVGGGPELEPLKRQYGDMRNVRFTGQQNHVEEWLKASDVFISSSISEGLPTSVIEAMAMGLPVVLSDIPQHCELFELSAGIGAVYKLYDVADLTEKLSQATADWCAACAPECLRVSHHELSAERMSLAYQRLYRNL
jgi:glycosyltransferase involved in cell wall biosynthesis